jgi:DNA repair protein RadC
MIQTIKDEYLIDPIDSIEVCKCCNVTTDIETYDTPIQILNKKDVYNLLIKVGKEIGYREHFYLICMNNKNNVIGVYDVFIGGISSSIVDMGVLLRIPIILGCNKIIVAHNHPTGSLDISDQDKEVTKKIKRACEYLSIDLLDAVVFSYQGIKSIIHD